MNDLQVFSSSEFGELGVLTIGDREYFPATACAKILGYANPRKAVLDHCQEDGVTKRNVIDSLGRNQQMKYITEGNLYRLIVNSKLPSAKRFERWVFDEVLPTLRKQGAYTPDMGTLITQTVQATVGEVMRQLAPLLGGTVQAEPPAKRRQFQPLDLVGRLDTELREEVEDMLLSRRYTLCQIAAYLQEHHGIHISRSALHRHRAKLSPYDEEGA